MKEDLPNRIYLGTWAFRDQIADVLVQDQVKSNRNRRVCMNRLSNVDEAKKNVRIVASGTE